MPSKKSKIVFKTKHGEHDFHQYACSEYCLLGADFCPFNKLKNKAVQGITRWTDVAENVMLLDENGQPSGIQKYVANFEKSSQEYPFSPTKPSDLAVFSEKNQNELWINGFSCWGDGSGFEYDRMSKNIIGPEPDTESIYDITNYQISHEPLQFSGWNAWIEKFQYDYRFGRVSDRNAECVLFPNVDNPWMFTEYVFQGIGGENSKGKTALSIPAEYVVEPPVYNAQTLELKNGSITLGFYTDEDVLNKYGYTQSNFSDDPNKTVVERRFRVIDNWTPLLYEEKEEDQDDESSSSGFESSSSSSDSDETVNTVKKPLFSLGCSNAGVKLYCAKIPVQSIKWGEHGNIPPHTLDMTAPTDWLDPTAGAWVVRPVYDTTIGIAFRSEYYGIVRWIGLRKAQVEIYEFYKTSLGLNLESGKKVYDYSNQINHLAEGTGRRLEMPPNPDRYKSRNASRILVPTTKYYGGEDEQNGEYCHGGCQLCVGKSGKLRCKFLEALNDPEEIEELNEYFIPIRCLTNGGYDFGGEHQADPCPHYISGDVSPIIATYDNTQQYEARKFMPSDGSTSVKYGIAAQISDASAIFGASMTMSALLIGGGGMVGVLTGMSIAAYASFTYFDLLFKILRGNPDNGINFNGAIRYEVVKQELQRPRLNQKKGQIKGFGQDVQIVPKTGKFAIDTENANDVFGGGDTNVYNDINTLSFPRFFCSVMHCATQENCNPWKGEMQRQGFVAGTTAGGDGKCRYYRKGGIGCPYNGTPKRAVEFSRTAQYMSVYLQSISTQYMQMCDKGIWADEDDRNLQQKFAPDTIGKFKFEDMPDGTRWVVFFGTAVRQDTDSVATIAVKSEITKNDLCSSSHGGAALLKSEIEIAPDGSISNEKFAPEGFAIVGKMKTKKMHRTASIYVEQKQSEGSGSSSSSTQEEFSFNTYAVEDTFYWYRPLTDSGKTLVYDFHSPLTQNVDSNGCWLCKADTIYTAPKGNCIIIDNEEKFIGGWHPEYKDYGEMGDEYMQTISDEQLREEHQGDIVNNGDYKPVPNPTSQKGYWVDATGVYIVDERSIGLDKPIASEDVRKHPFGPGTCISFRKSNTEIDPNGMRKSPKTLNGAVFSNDPMDLVYYIYPKRGQGIKWKYDELTGEAKPKKIVNGIYEDVDDLKPMFEDPDYDNRRYYAPCYISNPFMLPTMRMAMHCPECDYYISYRYHDIKYCPWCHSELEFIPGDAGSGLDENNKWTESEQELDKLVIKKFFKIYAFGNVDVWAPPGTSIKTDAYFWRHQTQVSNALKNQIYHRVGGYRADKGYTFGSMSPQSEITLGMPEGIGKFVQTPDKIQYTATSNGRYTRWQMDADFVNSQINPIMPVQMLPMLTGDERNVFGQKEFDPFGGEDEGVIAPFTGWSNDALKMLTVNNINGIRNTVEPMLAYVYDPKPTDYPQLRASFEQRERVDRPIVYQHRRPTVQPVVLAVTDDFEDSYVKYLVPEGIISDEVREYYPSGYTWWYMNQYLGGRGTACEGGPYHMDNGKNLKETIIGYYDAAAGFVQRIFLHSASGNHVVYTRGHLTSAYVTLSIYGVLPLDKEIVKAYMIFYTNQCADPSRGPAGYNWAGFLGRAQQPLYHHYHAFTVNHKQKLWDSETRQWMINPIGDGFQKHFHGEVGEGKGIFYDADGNRLKRLDDGQTVNVNHGGDSHQWDWSDDSMYRLWGFDTGKIEDDRDMYYQYDFGDTMTGLSGAYDYAFYQNVGTPKKAIHGAGAYKDTTVGFGYDNKSFSEIAGFKTYNIDSNDEQLSQRFEQLVVNGDGELVLVHPVSSVWKKTSTSELNEAIDLYKVDLQYGVSDGTEEGTIKGPLSIYATDLKTQIKAKTENVEGYFNMDWTNSRGYTVGKYNVETSSGIPWEYPVVFQAEYAEISGGGTSAGHSGDIFGKDTYAVDITSLISKIYNTRIERLFFSKKAGQAFGAIARWPYYKSREFRGKKEIEQKNIKDDYILRLNEYIKNPFEEKSCLLTDSTTYPKVENDMIPSISEEGDKYPVADETASFLMSYDQKTIINAGINDQCAFQFADSVTELNLKKPSKIVKKQISPKTVEGYSGIKSILLEVFGNEIKVERLTGSMLKVSSKRPFMIAECENNFFKDYVGVYDTRMDRTISVSAYSPGFHPSNLLGSGSYGWMYESYQSSPQSFVFDLARAPLCVWKKDYRFRPTFVDYSMAKCTLLGCLAHSVGAGIAANRKGKSFDASSDECPICKSKLKGGKNTPGDGFDTYKYDSPFSPDPFWGGIYIMPYSGMPCTCRISAKNSNHQEWQPVLDVSFGNTGSIYVTYSYGNLYNDEQKKKTGEYYIPLEKASLRARFMKVDCFPIQRMKFHQYKIKEYDGFQMVVEGDFSNMEGFSFQGHDAVIGYQQDETTMNAYEQYQAWVSELARVDEWNQKNIPKHTYKTAYGDRIHVVSAQIEGDEENQMRISFQRHYPFEGADEDLEGEDEPPRIGLGYIKFYTPFYYGGISALQLYGTHYKTEPTPGGVTGYNIDPYKNYFMTVTDPFDEACWDIQRGVVAYPLTTRPTQIDRVVLSIRNSGAIKLEEVASPEELMWQTESKTLTGTDGKQYEYKTIIGGNYYYDIKNKKMVIPQYDQNNIHWTHFEDYLKELNPAISYMPQTLIMYYLTGNGKSITIPFTANGCGPSYMLEKNAIQEIVTRTLSEAEDTIVRNGGVLQEGGPYLPYNGRTCKIYDTEGVLHQGEVIKWICYNSTPATPTIEQQSYSRYKKGDLLVDGGGYWPLPKITGKELVSNKQQASNLVCEPFLDSDTMNFTCITDVTFYGGANKIISASPLWVKALDFTDRVTEINGTFFAYKEQTGGIPNGFLTACIRPDVPAHGRKTVCFPLPKMVIYARERNNLVVVPNPFG